MALTALAGPLCNLVLSFLSLLIYYFAFYGTVLLAKNYELSDFACKFLAYLLLMLNLGHHLNLSLCIFNLIPIPPLDGSRILYVFLPPKYYFGLMKYERYVSIALLLLLWLGIADIPLAYVTSRVSDAMTFIINLIPLKF